MLAAGWVTPWAVAAALIDPSSLTLTSRSSASRSGHGCGRGVSPPYDVMSRSPVRRRRPVPDTGPVPVLDQRPLDGDIRQPAGATPVSYAGRLVPGALLVAGGGGHRHPGRRCGPRRWGPGGGRGARPGGGGGPPARAGAATRQRLRLRAGPPGVGRGARLRPAPRRCRPAACARCRSSWGTSSWPSWPPWGAARLLGVRDDAGVLVGVGTAICGVSATAAADAVIDADEADVGYAIATIFTFNIVAVLAYPSLGHARGLGQHAFGLWAGTAINDLSSVVVASTVYGHAAAATGVVVKLTRSLAILPIRLGPAALRSRRRGAPGGRCLAAAAADRPPVHPRLRPRRPRRHPRARAHGLAPRPVGRLHLDDHRRLAAVGLSFDPGRIRRAGLRPLALGAVQWATVGLTSLGAAGAQRQRLTAGHRLRRPADSAWLRCGGHARFGHVWGSVSGTGMAHHVKPLRGARPCPPPSKFPLAEGLTPFRAAAASSGTCSTGARRVGGRRRPGDHRAGDQRRAPR
jgi:hypothetical protein